MKTDLIAVRLERTRVVLRELLHSLRGALPIVVGVAGPIAIASLALLAWAGVPPMKAVTMPWPAGIGVWAAQTVAFAWPLWALRTRLVPTPWCVQLRCLPVPTGALLASDLAVSAALLWPLGVLYAISAATFALHRTPWFLVAWPEEIGALALSWMGSCLLGAAALAGWRRAPAPGHARPVTQVGLSGLAGAGPGFARAVTWLPWWRDAMQPSGAAIAGGLAVAGVASVAWTRKSWPAVPSGAWALVVNGLLIALTERMQRAQEAHATRLDPWLRALPLARGWIGQGRLLLALPMGIAAGVLVGLVLASGGCRPGVLAAYAAGLLATPFALGALPASQREAHVGLWAVCAGVLTALGSELWR